MKDVISLLLGIAAAGYGGELFVNGTVGIARRLRIPPGIVAATIAAFATSAPELSVAITAAVSGEPAIALGDALGSNVVNVALVLGTVVALGGIAASWKEVRRDYLTAVAAAWLIAALASDGSLGRLDAALLFAVFVAWLVASVRAALEDRAESQAPDDTNGSGARAALTILPGLVLLGAAGRLIVLGASGLAIAWGFSDFVVGALVVSIGTSVPELATALLARRKGHDEVGLGTVLGSNVFNFLFIVPTAAAIHPIDVRFADVASTLAAGLVTVLLAWPGTSGRLGRSRGLSMLAVYAVYVVSTMRG